MVEHMFLGRFYHNIDDKGRLMVPARFRAYLTPDGVYVMQGFERNLMVFPARTFEAVSQKIQSMTFTEPTARLLRRLIYSTANHVEIDRVGRFLIPQFLREAANLDVSVIVVGNGDYFEVWSPEAWEEQDQELRDVQSNATRFADLMVTTSVS
ncbi:MAG: division/cell wall cluster transcriptional repressor MraZ [Anaerolineales bacterium]|jgi:MraZ protein|nr:division/cell wall cluster transcriptional repressor MraZ [Anaerolineales bacterium]